MTHLTLGILEGDDIGHEIVPAAVEVIRAAAEQTGLAIDWRPMPVGRRALDSHGATLPEGTLETLSTFDGFILGPIGHQAYPKVPGAINPHPIMRKHFNLFANVRPTKSFPGLGALRDDIDLVIVRENTEGFYADRAMFMGPGEFMPTPDVALAVRKITRENSLRIARSAFELAMTRDRHVTAVHKANVLRPTDGPVLECTRARAQASRTMSGVAELARMTPSSCLSRSRLPSSAKFAEPGPI